MSELEVRLRTRVAYAREREAGLNLHLGHPVDYQRGSLAVTIRWDELEQVLARVADLEDALAVAQAEVAVERGRVADLMTMNVGLAAIVKDLKARLAALEDDLRQAAEVEVEP